jgi:hypothetical protein
MKDLAVAILDAYEEGKREMSRFKWKIMYVPELTAPMTEE